MEAPFDIFRRCKWDVVAGMSGAVWHGIAAPEIESVARMAGIPMTGELLDEVRLMERAALQVLNRRN